jgi:hypothetical protein
LRGCSSSGGEDDNNIVSSPLPPENPPIGDFPDFFLICTLYPPKRRHCYVRSM